jgi:hypothetical protein
MCPANRHTSAALLLVLLQGLVTLHFWFSNIEDVRTFAGQQVTISFWAKADATKNIAVELVQGFGSGGSPSTEVLQLSALAKYPSEPLSKR